LTFQEPEYKDPNQNLLEFSEYVNNYVDSGKPKDLTYLDFRKAFDKVLQRRLMEKVRPHGIRGLVSNWIEEWLSNREQRVVLLKWEKNELDKSYKWGPSGIHFGANTLCFVHK
jgi:hypothetical protein